MNELKPVNNGRRIEHVLGYIPQAGVLVTGLVVSTGGIMYLIVLAILAFGLRGG